MAPNFGHVVTDTHTLTHKTTIIIRVSFSGGIGEASLLKYPASSSKGNFGKRRRKGVREGGNIYFYPMHMHKG